METWLTHVTHQNDYIYKGTHAPPPKNVGSLTNIYIERFGLKGMTYKGKGNEKKRFHIECICIVSTYIFAWIKKTTIKIEEIQRFWQRILSRDSNKKPIPSSSRHVNPISIFGRKVSPFFFLSIRSDYFLFFLSFQNQRRVTLAEDEIPVMKMKYVSIKSR